MHPDIQILHEQLARFSAATRQLETITTRLAERALRAGMKDGAAILRLREECTAAADIITETAARHPEWFAASKTLDLLTGAVKCRTTRRLVPVTCEANVLAAIEQSNDARLAHATRHTSALNLEVLERLDVETLAAIGMRWEEVTTLSVVPAEGPVKSILRAASAAAEPAALAA